MIDSQAVRVAGWWPGGLTVCRSAHDPADTKQVQLSQVDDLHFDDILRSLNNTRVNSFSGPSSEDPQHADP